MVHRSCRTALVGQAASSDDDPIAERAGRGAEELAVDRAIYLVDRTTRTYRYGRRNPGWAELDPEDNERHKRSLTGYERIFPDGRRKVFAYPLPGARLRERRRSAPDRP